MRGFSRSSGAHVTPRKTAIAVAACLLLGAGTASASTPVKSFRLSSGNTSRWAYVLKPAAAHSAPRMGSRIVARLPTVTAEGTRNLVLLLDARLIARVLWLHVSLPILPNNSTGWVRSRQLGPAHTVHTRLVIDRARFRATLYRSGVVVFRMPVGIGRPGSPTPAGSYYIRERLTNLSDPFYGPLAFGSSGRSPTLTDWPGGGYVGIHGTNRPDLIPGRISHGCIRMTNDAILRLGRLMPLGTPVVTR